MDSLNDYQMSELKRFQDWLYQKRTQARLDMERGERHQKKAEEAEQRKVAQLTLFEF